MNTTSKELISVEKALEQLESNIDPIGDTERLELKNGLDRILAEDIVSPVDIPLFRNSSMDGYAFDSSAEKLSEIFTLSVKGTSWAGRPYLGVPALTKDQCVRIYTGAVVPQNADVVVMQENVERIGDTIKVLQTVAPGLNIREPGEDVREGQVILPKNKKLSPSDLALMASVGIYDVLVKRKLRISFFSTGDELRPIGAKLREGEIYDSNRYLVQALLEKMNVEIFDLGTVKDQQDAIAVAFKDAANHSDIIITTGGVSVGDADHVRAAMEETGDIHLWKIAIKPGKPLAYGNISNCHFFGLPGNPASVLVTFQVLVRPMILRLQGIKENNPLCIKARCQSALSKTPGRQEYQRGIFSRVDSGEYRVESAGTQGSHILSAASRSNCFIVLPRLSTGAQVGEWVDIEPFETML
ncbi:MAG: gephyrin-like molybdotransferase Glp [Methylococcales bacterium]